jgi:hypothetical protein
VTSVHTGYFTVQTINMNSEQERTHDDGHRHAHPVVDGPHRFNPTLPTDILK